jgi:hypothetical protein
MPGPAAGVLWLWRTLLLLQVLVYHPGVDAADGNPEGGVALLLSHTTAFLFLRTLGKFLDFDPCFELWGADFECVGSVQ